MSDHLCAKGRAWIEVDLEAIRANVVALRDVAGPHAAVMAVVKADAYGHGLVPVTRAALGAGAAWVGVAAVAEGVALREAGIEAPILLLCALAPGEVEVALAHRLTLTLGDEAGLNALLRAASGRAVEAHLEVDTGIGRAGVRPGQAIEIWQRATAAGLRLTGLMTHFADADGPDPALTRSQRAAFTSVREALHRAGARFKWVHLENSAAIAGRNAESDPAAGNLMRPGLLLYGVRSSNHGEQRPLPITSEPCANASSSARSSAASYPSSPLPSTSVAASSFILHPSSLATASSLPFRPALALYARVASVRDLPVGHPISYGATHRLRRDSRVATVLIGYGDGYPRRLSNVGHMLLSGRRAPILGRVCMDQTVVDVTDIPNVVPGDIAVCIGVQGRETLGAELLAACIEATEHEIITCLSPRLPRLYREAELPSPNHSRKSGGEDEDPTERSEHGIIAYKARG
jgi:alanine racemase